MAVFKDELRGTWYTKFYYIDWRGKRKQAFKRGFLKKSEALAYENDYKNRSKQLPSLTLNTLSKSFLDDYKLHRRPNSYKAVETNIRLHILPELGDMPVSDITPLTVRTWQNLLIKKDLSDSTLHAINGTFKTVMNYAVKYYNLAVSPFAHVEPLGKMTARHDIIDNNDWGRLCSVITHKHDKAVFSLLFWSGMRVGELQGLTAADFDFTNKTVNINKQYNSTTKEIGPLKTSTSKRCIVLPDVCIDVVQEYFNALIEVPFLPFTFKTPRGLNHKLKRYCLAADIKPVSLHAFRHSHASMLIREGIPINLISERLGHSTPAITLRIYSHIYNDHNTQLAAALNTLGANTPA